MTMQVNVFGKDIAYGGPLAAKGGVDDWGVTFGDVGSDWGRSMWFAAHPYPQGQPDDPETGQGSKSLEVRVTVNSYQTGGYEFNVQVVNNGDGPAFYALYAFYTDPQVGG